MIGLAHVDRDEREAQRALDRAIRRWQVIAEHARLGLDVRRALCRARVAVHQACAVANATTKRNTTWILWARYRRGGWRRRLSAQWFA